MADEPPSWVYINGLGERETESITEQDTLTTISFDGTGDYLAVGDKAGRVIIFKHSGPIKNSRYFDYRYFAEVQSHEPEFDHLKSIELEEKINHVQFLNTRAPKHRGLGGGESLQFLSTNDRIIKLWKVEYKVRRAPAVDSEIID